MFVLILPPVPVNVSGAYPVSGMITVPLPVYQTVVANIQGADGQPLQVVTPIVQVPKLEPGLDNNVEVPAALNASLDASTIISSGQGHVQVGQTLFFVLEWQRFCDDRVCDLALI